MTMIVVPRNFGPTFVDIIRHSLSPPQVVLSVLTVPSSMAVDLHATKSKAIFIIVWVLSYPGKTKLPLTVNYIFGTTLKLLTSAMDEIRIQIEKPCLLCKSGWSAAIRLRMFIDTRVTSSNLHRCRAIQCVWISYVLLIVTDTTLLVHKMNWRPSSLATSTRV